MSDEKARLTQTMRSVVEHAYLRAAARLQGRQLRDMAPDEAAAVLELFADALEADTQLLAEVGERWRLLGAPAAPEAEPDEGMVLDTGDQ